MDETCKLDFASQLCSWILKLQHLALSQHDMLPKAEKKYVCIQEEVFKSLKIYILKKNANAISKDDEEVVSSV